jgi:hypothetical protein
MSQLIRILFGSLLILALLSTSSVYARPSGDWTEKFILSNSSWILHEPHQININNSFLISNSMYINGLYLSVDMTRRQFINQLIIYGLIDLDDYIKALK